MRRLIGLTVVVLMMVVPEVARASFLNHYFGGRYRSSYGYNYYGYGSYRPSIGGYGCGPAGYSYRSWWDQLTGETDRTALEILKADQEFRHDQARRAEDKEIFDRANQAGKLQREIEWIEREKQELLLEQKIAELENKINQLLAAKKAVK